MYDLSHYLSTNIVSDSFSWLFPRPNFWEQTYIFISLTIQGLGLGLLISIPLGILLTRFKKFADPIISMFALLQTIPSLALLGFCVSMLQMVGAPVAILASVLYGLFPIVLNTYTGIIGVSPRLKDAARGMGMSNWQILKSVELPLAMPVIMAGIRTGAVYAIGIITICALVGAKGLGEYITTGMSRGDVQLTLLGVVPILIITIAFFLGLSGIVILSAKNSQLGLRIGGGLVVAMAIFAVVSLSLPLLYQDGTTVTVTQTSPNQVADEETNRISLWTTWQQAELFWPQTLHFLSLTLRGLGLALLIGVPIGVILTWNQKTAQPIITGLALIQTTPSLALLGFCVSLFALFGSTAAIFGTVIYCLFPIVLNTYTGIRQIDPRLKDSAKGMGMTRLQILRDVEMPLALPVIMAGVRTAAIYAISMVTICSLVGARGLGDFIIDGMSKDNYAIILLGIIPILVLSFSMFWILGGITWLADKSSSLGQYVSVALILLLAGYAVAEPWFRKEPDILVGSKDFTENRILGEIIRIMIAENTNLSVEISPNLGSNFAFKSLLADMIDVYPEYTGTLLTAEDALARTVPEDKSQIEEIVRKGMEKKFQLILLPSFGLNNTYAPSMNKTKADSLGLKTISDIKSHPKLRFAAAQEFNERPDGWKGLKEVYKLKNADPDLYSANLMYKALKAGQTDIVIGFATDWQIEVLDLFVLEDNKNYFPSYHAAPLIRQDTLNKYPELGTILDKLAGQIDDATIRELNRRVVVDERRAPDVAREFLESKNLIPKNSR